MKSIVCITGAGVVSRAMTNSKHGRKIKLCHWTLRNCKLVYTLALSLHIWLLEIDMSRDRYLPLFNKILNVFIWKLQMFQMQNIETRLWKFNYLNLNNRTVAFQIKPCIIHIQILMTLSLTTHSTKSNNNSLAVELTSGALLAAGATLNAPLQSVTVAIWRSDWKVCSLSVSNPLKSLVSVPGLPSTACWVRKAPAPRRPLSALR